MKKPIASRLRPLSATLLAGVLLLSAGCASKPTLYYTLASAATVTADSAAAPTSAPLYIELAPVAVPERLARPQMVVRQPGDGASAAQVEVLEQHRWAASFESELRDALASGVADRLGAIDVTKGGRQNSQPVYRIAVQLRQFDAVEGSRVDADFGWTLRRSDADRASACQLKLSEPVGPGIDAVAQGARRVTAAAAAAIARSVAADQSHPGVTCRI